MNALDKLKNQSFEESTPIEICIVIVSNIVGENLPPEEILRATTEAAAELAALRARVEALEGILYEINNMNDTANLSDAELWNVNGETQKRVDAALKT